MVNNKTDSVDVSIILVNYKTSALSHNAIKSIREKTLDCSYEIILVDNSDSDDEFEKLTDLSNDIKLVKASNNLGFGKGNNLGACEANGTYLLFLNNDTLLENDAVSIMCKFLNEHNEVDIVGANLYSQDGHPNASYEKKEKNLYNEFSLLSAIGKKIKRDYYFNNSKKPKRIRGYISGACLMIRKSTFDNLGGFSNDIFMYAEESLLCFEAIKKLNAKIYNIPSAKIIHFEGCSSKQTSIKKATMFVDGNYLYFYKAFGADVAKKYLKKAISKYRRRALISKLFKMNKSVYNQTMLDAYKSKYLTITGVSR